MIFALSALLALPTAMASDITAELTKAHQIAIPAAECKNVEDKLGQVLYATVYLSSPEPKYTTANEKYISLVKDLNLGGVLPHYYQREETVNFNESIHDWNQKLKSSAASPLYVGVDYVEQCGLGYGQGALGIAPEACKKDFFDLEAACHAAYGVNHALGPTVERNAKNPYSLDTAAVKADAEELMKSFARYGVATTLKHFPYTPEDYNLHRQSSDTKLNKDEVRLKLENFSSLANSGADFVMSTHLYNTSVDPNDMATFSKTWVSYLREYAKFDGILMTDALFMISGYQENMVAMSMKFDQSQFKQQLDQQSIFAIRALLSGHDMVFLDGASDLTRRVFRDLLYVSCQNTPLAQQLRARVLASSDKNKKFKTARAKSMTANPAMNTKFLEEANRILREAKKLTPPSRLSDLYCAGIKAAVASYPPVQSLESYHFPKLATGTCDLNVNTQAAANLVNQVDEYLKKQTITEDPTQHP